MEPNTLDGRYTCQLTGQWFETAEARDQHTTSVIHRRNAYAGRELSPSELLNAPRKADARTLEERSAWRLAHPLVTAQQERPAMDPLSQMQDPRFYGTEKRETVAQFRERTVREMKAKLEAKPVTDPARDRAKAAATEALELAQYRPDLSVQFVDLGRLLVECAAKGSLADFERYHAEFVDGLDAIEAAKTAEINLAISKLQAAKVQRFTVEEPKEPKPEPVKTSNGPPHYSELAIELASPEEAERMRAANEQFWHWRTTRNDS